MLSYKNKLLCKQMVNHKLVQSMKRYRQHGDISTFDHSLNVLKISYMIADKWNLSEDEIKNLIIGALLHDFYLYDWHDGRRRKEGIHAWSHPVVALKNANEYFDLNDHQCNIIRSHMYPTCFLHPPKCKEAWAVVLADKYCAISEYFYDGILHKPMIVKSETFSFLD